ncbi:MAG: 1,4-dihydroxy-2-naphthoate octaprenyltransferase [Bacteroidales bacterium]|jgi:1,4-dihydroxy-2-naphthoate octaprenyltransferase|nr:1,4-dihydroxy-2-naphthoate octaprenyltransferase [Bacteroidales bacterium]
MMNKWIRAARLRTLPLTVSGILAGAGLAYFYGDANWEITFLALITAISIQIFSNFANDYGDSCKGVDNANRIGPLRAVQSGEITPSEMRRGMAVMAIISLVCGIWLLWETLAGHWAPFFLFLTLGLLALWAAWAYTGGKHPYGYAGLGDIAVFLFFGILAVVGSFFLIAGRIEPLILLPASSIGLFSVGVLNLNNMRDAKNDRVSGKITIPVRLGSRNSRIYHALLIIAGWTLAVIFAAFTANYLWHWLFLLAAPLFAVDTYKVCTMPTDAGFDPFLKRLSLSTFTFSILLFAGIWTGNL